MNDDRIANLGAAFVMIGGIWLALGWLGVLWDDGWSGLAPGLLLVTFGIVLIAYSGGGSGSITDTDTGDDDEYRFDGGRDR